jgi:hypothetical protein
MAETEESRNYSTIQLQILARQWGLGENVDEVENRLRLNGGEIPRAIRNRDGVLIIPLWIHKDGHELYITPNEHGAPKLNEDGSFEEWTYEGQLLDLFNQRRPGMAPLSLEDLEDKETQKLIRQLESDLNYTRRSMGLRETFRDHEIGYIKGKHELWRSIHYDDLPPLARRFRNQANAIIQAGAPRVEREQRQQQIEEEEHLRSLLPYASGLSREDREQQEERKERDRLEREARLKRQKERNERKTKIFQEQAEEAVEPPEKRSRERENSPYDAIECTGDKCGIMGGYKKHRSNHRKHKKQRKGKTMKRKSRSRSRSRS